MVASLCEGLPKEAFYEVGIVHFVLGIQNKWEIISAKTRTCQCHVEPVTTVPQRRLESLCL